MAIPLSDPPLARATPFPRGAPQVEGAQLQRGGRFVLETCRLAGRHRGLLVPLVGGVLAQILLWFWVLWMAVMRDVRPNTLAEALLALAGLFLGTTIECVVRGLVVDMVGSYLRGTEPHLGRAADVVSQRLESLLGLALTGTFIRWVTRFSRGAGMVRAWDIGSFLVVPVLVLEGRSLAEALERARSLQTDKVLPIEVGAIGVGTVTNVVAATLMGSYLACFFSLVKAPPPWPLQVLLPWLVGGMLLMACCNMLGALAEGTYCTCLYLWAREVLRDTEVAEVRVPDLLLSALRPAKPVTTPPVPESPT